MIVCDLDGTLLNNKQEITLYTQQVIYEVSKRVPFVLATARPIRDTITYLNQLTLKTPSIHCNGAVVYSHVEQKVIRSHTINGILAKRFMDLLLNNGAIHHCWAEKNDRFWVLSEDDEDIKQWTSFGQKPADKGYPSCFFDDHVDKLLVYGDEKEIIRIADQEFRDQLIYTYSDSRKKWLEILSIKAGKAAAVQYLSTYFNVPLENVIAFGDADNDLEMIEMVGTGVAMYNAPDYLKARANEVTLSNEENGVAKYLAKTFSIAV
ncbi:phosphatase [Caldalkalibacillus thermarum]|uniref:Cof-type HAD-IIB family hydrolase n=1 Tax=Caldalkalibacillus thermarum TaxID=296745 RepID=UPI001667B6C9|nr:Cof-type HAD-IIB family hydrolase [Caldalkalibacillus thermarum]GGK34817.1 phosphatase [Caldalkalibacillus thermarum]